MVAIRIAAFVLPLGLDTLAIAVALGMRGAPLVRAAVTFAVFEALMPLAGLALGSVVPRQWETDATIAGGIILALLGIHVMRESGELGEEAERLSFASPRLALLAGLAVSMDELAIGFPLAFSHLPVTAVLAAIGAQAFAVTLLGIAFGRRLGERFAASAGRIAGAAFVCVGAWIALEALHPAVR